jgi:hypothetical protein
MCINVDKNGLGYILFRVLQLIFCPQLRTVLANMDGQPMSFMSRIGDLPEPEEIFTAYETQKNVINQLKEQVTTTSAVFRSEHSFCGLIVFCDQKGSMWAFYYK